jgi:hypothetical protein
MSQKLIEGLIFKVMKTLGIIILLFGSGGNNF